MEKVVQYERSPHYYETDRMGVIHHSNYIRWFEEARTYYMEQLGYSYEKIEEEGLMLPVVSAECEYRSSVKYGDTVIIRTAVTEFNGFKMVIQYLVADKETNELRARGSTTHCFTDKTMKPVRIKNTFPELFELYSSYTSEKLF